MERTCGHWNLLALKANLIILWITGWLGWTCGGSEIWAPPQAGTDTDLSNDQQNLSVLSCLQEREVGLICCFSTNPLEPPNPLLLLQPLMGLCPPSALSLSSAVLRSILWARSSLQCLVPGVWTFKRGKTPCSSPEILVSWGSLLHCPPTCGETDRANIWQNTMWTPAKPVPSLCQVLQPWLNPLSVFRESLRVYEKICGEITSALMPAVNHMMSWMAAEQESLLCTSQCHFLSPQWELSKRENVQAGCLWCVTSITAQSGGIVEMPTRGFVCGTAWICIKHWDLCFQDAGMPGNGCYGKQGRQQCLAGGVRAGDKVVPFPTLNSVGSGAGRGRSVACPDCIREWIQIFSGRFSPQRGAKMYLDQTPKSFRLCPVTLWWRNLNCPTDAGQATMKDLQAVASASTGRTLEIAPGLCLLRAGASSWSGLHPSFFTWPAALTCN